MFCAKFLFCLAYVKGTALHEIYHTACLAVYEVQGLKGFPIGEMFFPTLSVIKVNSDHMERSPQWDNVGIVGFVFVLALNETVFNRSGTFVGYWWMGWHKGTYFGVISENSPMPLHNWWHEKRIMIRVVSGWGSCLGFSLNSKSNSGFGNCFIISFLQAGSTITTN